MITITEIGDRNDPEWMIRITGIRTLISYLVIVQLSAGTNQLASWYA